MYKSALQDVTLNHAPWPLLTLQPAPGTKRPTEEEGNKGTPAHKNQCQPLASCKLHRRRSPEDQLPHPRHPTPQAEARSFLCSVALLLPIQCPGHSCGMLEDSGQNYQISASSAPGFSITQGHWSDSQKTDLIKDDTNTQEGSFTPGLKCYLTTETWHEVTLGNKLGESQS